jgi:hypothetical protein
VASFTGPNQTPLRCQPPRQAADLQLHTSRHRTRVSLRRVNKIPTGTPILLSPRQRHEALDSIKPTIRRYSKCPPGINRRTTCFRPAVSERLCYHDAGVGPGSIPLALLYIQVRHTGRACPLWWRGAFVSSMLLQSATCAVSAPAQAAAASRAPLGMACMRSEGLRGPTPGA